jgi:acetyl-CoA acetyltransferase
LPSKKGQPQSLEADEHPRAQTTIESLKKLPSVFVKDTGVVSAGNASGICDGAAANIVMSDKAVKQYGVKPLARIAAYAWSACEPEIMGIGPVVSVQEALKKAGKTVSDMDIIEVNEVRLKWENFTTILTRRHLLHNGSLCRESWSYRWRRRTCSEAPSLWDIPLRPVERG